MGGALTTRRVFAPHAVYRERWGQQHTEGEAMGSDWTTQSKQSRRRSAAIQRHFQPGKALVVFLALLIAGGALLAGGRFRPAVVLAANGLTVSKSSDGNPLIGGQIVYTITVENTGFNGNTKAYNLDVVDLLPPGISYVSTTAPAAPAITNVTTNQQQLLFSNLTDIAWKQTYSFTITATLAPNGTRTGILVPGTSPADDLVNTAEARVSNNPRVLATPVDNVTTFSGGTATVTNIALPFKLAKVTNQSTGVNQATGGCSGIGAGRGFSYGLTATNNTLNQTTGATITETLPYGVVYCGTSGGLTPAATVNPDGTTTLVYTLGTLATGQALTVTPDVAIPYTYPAGPQVGQLIDDDTVFTNSASLAGTYQGTTYNTGPKTSPVKAKYATVDKSDDKVTVNYNDTITYSLKTWTSTNYDINTLYVIDTIPNGQRYIAGSAMIGATPFPPTAIPTAIVDPCGGAANVADNTVVGVTVCKDGTTVVTWGPIDNTPLTPTVAGSDFTITLRTQQLSAYRDPGTPPVLAGDSFNNQVKIVYNAANIAAHTPPAGAGPINVVTRHSDQDSEGQGTNLPTLIKTIVAVTRGDGLAGDGTVASGGKSATAAVGDIVTFRLVYSGVVGEDQRDIVISDFLPSGYEYINGSSSYSGSYVSNGGTINGVLPGTANPDCAPTCAVGGELVYRLTGNGTDNIVPLNQNLTLELKARVISGTIGGAKNNLGKFSGSSTSGAAYSGRDQVEVTTLGPTLAITKTNNANANALGNQSFKYTVTIRNNGTSTAYGLANLVDTLPADIRYLGTDAASSASIAFVSYAPNVDTYGGTLTYQFTPASFSLAPGASVTVIYDAQIKPTPLVGSNQVNTASVASYRSQPVGTSPAGTYGPVSGTSTVHIAGDTINKSALLIIPQVNTSGRVTIGDRVTYTITYDLPANTTIANGVVRDCLPLGFHYITGTYTGSFSPPGAPITAAFPLTAGAGFTSGGNGTNPCPADQEQLSITIGTQTNNTANPVVFTMVLPTRITGLDQLSVQKFATYPGPNNRRSDNSTPNANYAYLYENGTIVASTNVPNNNANNVPNNDVYIPHLTPSKTIVRTSDPDSSLPAGLQYSVPAPPRVLVRQGGTVDYLLRLQNDGGSTAYDIAPLVDTLDNGLTLVNIYQSDSTCQTTTTLTGATVVGQTVTIPTPASIDNGASFYACLRATMDPTNPVSTLYNNLLALGNGTGDKYYSAPSGTIGRAAYTQNNTATATVRTPDVITFAPLANKTYGDPPTPLTATSSGGRPIDYSVAPGSTCAIIGSAPNFSVRITGAGNCTVIASQRGENLAPDVPQSFTIAKAPLTVKVNDITVPFGAPIASACVLAPTYPTGFVYGETTAALGGALTCTAPPTNGIGSFPLTPSGYTSNNYDITYLGARLTVVPCQVTLAITMLPAGTLQYSDQLTLRAQVTTCGGNVLPTGPVQFFVNGTIIGADVLDATGLAALPYQVFQNVGAHAITARYATTDSRFYGASAGPAPLTVTQENATVTYKPARYAFPVNNVARRGTVQLMAEVKDITATGGDPFPGDIRTARVRFVNAATGALINPACDNLPVALISTADTKVGTASCTFQSPAATLNIRIEVLGNYTGAFTLPQPVIVGSGSAVVGLPTATGTDLRAARREEA